MSTASDSQIFAHAIELPSHQRLAYLEQACAGDTRRLNGLLELIAAHDAADSLLQHRPVEETMDEPARGTHDFEGTSIGRYKVLQRLGEGGFGIVFMAEQTEPVRRKVALKIIKPGMDTRKVIARFEA
ncbi:MAG: serine/threonine protein kinase, partial [Planctomycetales bacterium]|nr:serine/threonine protein kinase [Planctomycetales bacterium]